MGSQKFLGVVVLYCICKTCGNAYIIFKTGPLCIHTLAPSTLLLLEALTDYFFRNLLEFGHHIRFYVLHGYETCPFETHFQSREQPKFTRSEVWRVRWLGDNRNVFQQGIAA
jgi:hypothetical protein